MNSKERQKYLRQHILISGKFSRKYLPKIAKLLYDIQSSLIASIKANGLQRAMSDFSMSMADQKLAKVLQALHEDVGLRYANINYRYLRAELSRKFLGRDDIWINDIKNYLVRHLLEKAVIRVHETARAKLLDMLQKALDEGLGEFEILNILNKENLLFENAQRIVRTEINMASNTGLLVSAKQFQMVMEKQWIAHRDFRTRGRNGEDKKDHYHMDGQTVGFEEMFIEPRTGEKVLHPSDPKGSAAMVINCRCTYVMIPKRDKAGNIIRKSEPFDFVEIEEGETSEQIEMKEAFDEIKQKIADLAASIKPPDLTGLVNGHEFNGSIAEVRKSVVGLKQELREENSKAFEKLREDLQSSLYNINRVNAKEKELTDEQLKQEVTSITEKFQQVEKSISEMDFNPNIEVKTDSSTVIVEINKVRGEIVKALDELKKVLTRKNNYRIDFTRDSNGLLISPIMVINE